MWLYLSVGQGLCSCHRNRLPQVTARAEPLPYKKNPRNKFLGFLLLFLNVDQMAGNKVVWLYLFKNRLRLLTLVAGHRASS